MTFQISQNPKIFQTMLPQNSSQSFAGDVQEYQSEDNPKLKAGAAVGLALAAAAGLYFCMKKPQKITKAASNVSDIASSVVDNIKPKDAADIKPPKVKGKGKIKITRNLPKAKKITVKREARVVRDAELAKQIKTEKIISQADKDISSLSRKVINGNQGLGSAKNMDKINKIVDNVTENLNKAEQEAEKLKTAAKELKTNKARKALRRAENRLTEARNEADKILDNAVNKAEELKQKAQEKVQNIAKNQSSPNYEIGQLKQKINAAKTTENALWNGYCGIKTKKGQPTGEAYLKKVIANPKESEAKKELAKKWLADLEKGVQPTKTDWNLVAADVDTIKNPEAMSKLEVSPKTYADVVVPEPYNMPESKFKSQKQGIVIEDAEEVFGKESTSAKKVVTNKTENPQIENVKTANNTSDTSKITKSTTTKTTKPESDVNIDAKATDKLDGSINDEDIQKLNEFKNTDYSFKSTDDFTQKGIYGQDVNDILNPLNKMDPSSPHYNPYENNLTNNYPNSFGTSMTDYSTGDGYSPFGF